MSTFLDIVKKRRTIYAIGKEQVVPPAAVEQIIREAVLHVPSSFNSQSARAVVLFGAASDKLWAITKETLRAIVPANAFAQTEQKIDGFGAGYGTVLYFEDTTVVEGLQKQFALYADNFPIWSLESSGMLQFAVWTALEEAGLGASLQHYNPLIDERVRTEWNLPQSWRLLGQMPFGKPMAPADEKEFQPIEQRVKVFGA